MVSSVHRFLHPSTFGEEAVRDHEYLINTLQSTMWPHKTLIAPDFCGMAHLVETRIGFWGFWDINITTPDSRRRLSHLPINTQITVWRLSNSTLSPRALSWRTFPSQSQAKTNYSSKSKPLVFATQAAMSYQAKMTCFSGNAQLPLVMRLRAS